MTMARTIRIGARRVGLGQAAFVIAEAGVNHNGRLDLALELVDQAARCGADAVKFQAFRPELLVTGKARRAPYQLASGRSSQREMLQSLTLPSDGLKTVAGHAAARGIMFLVTPFDEESLRTVVALGVKAIKLGSGEVTNFPLLRAAGRTRLPILLSTGMSTLAETELAVSELRRAGTSQLLLFHCVSAYPTPVTAMNLRAITTLAERLRVPVGLSDHSPGWLASLVALGLGAVAFEKHLTLDKTLPGPDHQASLDEPEFADFARSLREGEAALGDGVKRCTPQERKNVRAVRRSCVARRAIPRGATICADDIVAKRPAGGISPVDIDRVVGRRTRRAIPEDSVIRWSALRR
jgi:N,N'-diacetyllegionaminate synthase